MITVVPWQLGEDDVVEGRQRVNDPFARVAPPSDEPKLRTEQPGDTRSDSASEENS